MADKAQSSTRIGVLALQGAYAAHAAHLQSLGAKAILVRRSDQLAGLDGLIIPGGESTTFLRHLERDGMLEALSSFVCETPTFGTCAGAILLASSVSNPAQTSLGAMDISIERNSYGRQNDSVILAEPSSLPGALLEMVFIRAPRITKIGVGVETLASRAASPVLVRQGHLLAATFHPELSDDLRVHQFFVAMVEAHQSQRQGVLPA